MPMSGLIATTEYQPESRYRARERRPGSDRAVPADTGAASTAPPAEAGFDAAYYASRFKTDLSRLQAFDGAEEAPNPAGGEDEPALADFFGNLSTLLVAVRAGDILRAQAAADALELDALVEQNAPRRPGASAALVDELMALLSAAQMREEPPARPAMRERESAPPPAAFVRGDPYGEDEAPDDGGAAYDTLRRHLEGESGAL